MEPKQLKLLIYGLKLIYFDYLFFSIIFDKIKSRRIIHVVISLKIDFRIIKKYSKCIIF